MSTGQIFVAIGLMLVLWFAWTRNRTGPLVNHHDWDTVQWTTAAENYGRYGLVEARFAQILTPYAAEPANWSVYQTGPPGHSLLTFAAIQLWGNHPLSIRLAPILASMLSGAGIYTLARWTYGYRVGLLALFFFGLTPLIVYFSGKVGPEQFVLPILLLALLCLKVWYHRPRPHLLLVLGLLALVGGVLSWVMYVFVAVVAVYAMVRSGIRGVFRLWPFWTGIVLSGLAFLFLGVWQGGIFESLADGVRRRALNSTGYPVENWFGVVGGSLLLLFTPVLPMLAAIGLWSRIRRVFTLDEWLVALPGFSALVYNGIFWQATYIHDYFIWHFITPLSIWAGLGYVALLRRNPRGSGAWRAVVGLFPLIFVGASIRTSLGLYAIHEVPPAVVQWGEAAQRHTAPGEVLATNLPNTGPHIAYYAERPVRFEQSERDVRSIGEASVGLYLHCLPPGQDHPGWVLEATVLTDTANNCVLADLH